MTDNDERERLHQLEAAQIERLFGELYQTRQRRALRSRARMRMRGIPTEAERAAEKHQGDGS
jgi:hypothetical protein